MIDEAILFQLITFNHFYGLSLSLSQTLFIDEMPSVGDELIGNFIDNVNLFVSRVLDRRMEHVHTIYMFFQQTFISPSRNHYSSFFCAAECTSCDKQRD